MLAVRPGQLVTSKAGRDRGKQYLVVGLDPGGYLLVANGVERSVTRPKPKSRRHLIIHQQIAEEIADKLEKSMEVNDRELRAALERLTQRHRGGWPAYGEG
ncbi:MAG: RNA-binding protein [Limnochordia bacterium]|jgi:large subunit ribosomal protein L14e